MTTLLQIEELLLSTGLPLPIIAFLAGIISILSPCILPLLPAILAYSTKKGRFGPFAIVAGLALTFSVMGMFMAAFNRIFISYQQYIMIVAEIIIIILGITMLIEFNLNIFNSLSGRINIDPAQEGIAGGFILGMSLGIIWIPCTGPVLAAVLIVIGVLSKGGILYGSSLMFIYAMGLGIPMLLIAYSASISSRKLSTISRYDLILKRGAGAVLILVGLWMVYKNHILYV
jgi:cytochrome c-type biogenesis protein